MKQAENSLTNPESFCTSAHCLAKQIQILFSQMYIILLACSLHGFIFKVPNFDNFVSALPPVKQFI